MVNSTVFLPMRHVRDTSFTPSPRSQQRMVQQCYPTAMLLPVSERMKSIVNLHFETGLHHSLLLFTHCSPDTG
jgi:hypothetical protein